MKANRLNFGIFFFNCDQWGHDHAKRPFSFVFKSLPFPLIGFNLKRKETEVKKREILKANSMVRAKSESNWHIFYSLILSDSVDK